MKCPECKSKVIYDRNEYVCSECGLVVEEEIVIPVYRVSDYTKEDYLKPGTKLCDIQLNKINRRLKMMVSKEIDEEIIKYLKRRGIVDTKELWNEFKDRFEDKVKFYELLRRLKNQRRIKSGYVALRGGLCG